MSFISSTKLEKKPPLLSLLELPLDSDISAVGRATPTSRRQLTQLWYKTQQDYLDNDWGLKDKRDSLISRKHGTCTVGCAKVAGCFSVFDECGSAMRGQLLYGRRNRLT